MTTSSTDIYLYTTLGCIGVILLIILFWWIAYKLISKRARVPIHLKATSYFNAFLLNALVISIAIAVTTIINNLLQDKTEIWGLDSNIKSIITISTSFIATFSAYFIMYSLTGYGRGMFAPIPLLVK